MGRQVVECGDHRGNRGNSPTHPRPRRANSLTVVPPGYYAEYSKQEYCRYISTEDLDELIERVKGFGGHIQPSILDTVALGIDDEEDTENP